MAAKNWKMRQVVNLLAGTVKTLTRDDIRTVRGDARNIEWEVTVEDGFDTAKADLTGCTCSGYVVRADGQTVPLTGSISGNVCSLVLDALCQAIVGPAVAYMNLKDETGEVIVTLSTFSFYVDGGQTDTVVDPGDAFPDMSRLLQDFARLSAEVTDNVKVTKNEAETEVTVAFTGGKTYTFSIADDKITMKEGT